MRRTRLQPRGLGGGRPRAVKSMVRVEGVVVTEQRRREAWPEWDSSSVRMLDRHYPRDHS